MSFTEKLREIVDKVTDYIPGYKGYKDKESLRDSDKQLRDFIQTQLVMVKKNIDGWTKDASNSGDLGALKTMGSLTKTLEKITDKIKYAPRGYAGLFDEKKVEEEELEKLHQYDLTILEKVNALKTTATSGFSPENMKGAMDAIEELDNMLLVRSNVIKPL